MNDAPGLTVSQADRAAVTIRAIETIPLHVPFHTPFKISSGAPRAVVETLLVRIHTDGGPSGIGETQAWRRQGSAEVLANLVRTIQDYFAPQLVGRSPFDIAALMHGLNTSLYNSLYAQAAVGDALYDLIGKILGIPVYQLLGGRCRDRVRVGAVLSMKESTGDVVESAQAFHERGFRHFGLKIGEDPAVDLANAKALREHFGDGVVLRVDANAALTFDDALRLLKKLEPFDIDAAEQPVALWDLDGMAALARAVAMPIMADESVSTDHSLLEVIRRRAASVVQTKVAKNGGIHYTRALWNLARAAGLRIYPGNHPSTSVATASVAHLCAAWPEPLMEGVFAVGVGGALAADVVRNPIRPENGEIPIPDGPGLGVALDEERLASLRADL
jgi:L-alanine-DL-glutamate epimerase-like enolase superfamily enzyme